MPPSSHCRWQAYWIYWGVLFATPVTWVFALAATVNREWFINYEKDTFGGFGSYFCSGDYKELVGGIYGQKEVDEMCSTGESVVFWYWTPSCSPTYYVMFFEMCS